jgi:hypothetical protein
MKHRDIFSRTHRKQPRRLHSAKWSPSKPKILERSQLYGTVYLVKQLRPWRWVQQRAAAIKTGTVYDAGLNEEEINSLTRIPFHAGALQA